MHDYARSTPNHQSLNNHHDVIVGLEAVHASKTAPAFGRVLAEPAIDGRTDERGHFNVLYVEERYATVRVNIVEHFRETSTVHIS